MPFLHLIPDFITPLEYLLNFVCARSSPFLSYWIKSWLLSRTFGEPVALPFTKAQVHQSVKPLGCAILSVGAGLTTSHICRLLLEAFF
jgi:hypothetical protein